MSQRLLVLLGVVLIGGAIIWFLRTSAPTLTKEDRPEFVQYDELHPTPQPSDKTPATCPPQLKADTTMAEYRNRWEQIYQRNWDRTTAYIKERYKDRFEDVIPWNYQEATYLWDLIAPSYNCDERERVGRLSDGGKWICRFRDIERLPTCNVLSFGIDGEYTFEVELLERTNCTIYAFDASVDKPQIFNDKPRFIFHKKFIGSQPSATHTSLAEIMTQYNLSKVDFVKMDVEGSEFDVIRDWAQKYSVFPAAQLLIELHYNSNPPLWQLFKDLKQMGLRPFHNELNMNPCTVGQPPFAIEYSFFLPDVVLKDPLLP